MKKSRSFITGALILSAGGILTKILGAAYRIPLTNLLGARGMGIYQLIFPFYTLLLAASSAGIPPALSRLIAERLKMKDYRGARKVFITALAALGIAGIFFSAVMYFAADYAAGLQGDLSAAPGYRAIAPSVLFVSLISVLRGYFQGRLNMVPTALSQVTEQAVKIAFTLTVAVSFLPDTVKAVSFAVLSVSISEAAAFILLLITYYAEKKKRNFEGAQNEAAPVISARQAAFMIFVISIPVTIGSVILPLSQIADSALVINIIGKYNPGATALYGIFSGPVNSLIGFPVVITAAMASAAIPAISAGRVSGDKEGIKSKTFFVFKLTVLIALPCALGMFVFSENIIRLLYKGFSEAEILIASNLLKISSPSVLFISLMQASVSVLVALKRSLVTTLNLIYAVIIKIILSILLLRLPGLNIYGAAISAAVCYAAASALNLLYIRASVRPGISLFGISLKPLISACIAVLFAYGANALFGIFLSRDISLILAVVSCLPVFLFAVTRLEVFTDYELKYIPFLKNARRLKIRARRLQEP